MQDFTRHNPDLYSLKTVDMLLFPMQPHHGWYICVFNLKHVTFYILDHHDTDVPMALQYKGVPGLLQHLLFKYLALVNHPKAISMANIQPDRIDLPWKTNTVNNDSGIFICDIWKHLNALK